MIKNDLFLRALNNETVERPPVWMMRQAGRYLPEFRALRDKYDFFTRCETPELAAEITVQPIRIVKPDAANSGVSQRVKKSYLSRKALNSGKYLPA